MAARPALSRPRFRWWLGVLGKWDVDAAPGAEHVTIAVSGARDGDTVDFRAAA